MNKKYFLKSKAMNVCLGGLKRIKLCSKRALEKQKLQFPELVSTAKYSSLFLVLDVFVEDVAKYKLYLSVTVLTGRELGAGVVISNTVLVGIGLGNLLHNGVGSRGVLGSGGIHWRWDTVDGGVGGRGHSHQTTGKYKSKHFRIGVGGG